MKVVEMGGNLEGFYYTSFLEKDIADRKQQEQELEEGATKSHGTTETEEVDTE
jgi:hypothetical protein